MRKAARAARTMKMALAIGALATVVSAGGVASSAKLGHVVAVPGSSIAGYATRIVVITRGSTSFFHNLDIAPHDVRSRIPGLFSSAIVGLGKQAAINGTQNLAPATYQFFCSVHPGMTGTLRVR